MAHSTTVSKSCHNVRNCYNCFLIEQNWLLQMPENYLDSVILNANQEIMQEKNLLSPTGHCVSVCLPSNKQKRQMELSITMPINDNKTILVMKICCFLFWLMYITKIYFEILKVGSTNPIFASIAAKCIHVMYQYPVFVYCYFMITRMIFPLGLIIK